MEKICADHPCLQNKLCCYHHSSEYCMQKATANVEDKRSVKKKQLFWCLVRNRGECFNARAIVSTNVFFDVCRCHTRSIHRNFLMHIRTDAGCFKHNTTFTCPLCAFRRTHIRWFPHRRSSTTWSVDVWEQLLKVLSKRSKRHSPIRSKSQN